MKKLITPIAIIVALFGLVALGYTVADHYTKYQNRQDNARQAEADARTKELSELRLQVEAAKNERDLYQKECQKGAAAYSLLSSFSKRSVEAPSCGGE